MLLNGTLGALAVLSLALLLWQWSAGRRFPLHQRLSSTPFHPGVTLLKPLKGCDEATETCLRSWLAQQYPGPMQILFAVASAHDPVCELVRRLLREFPKVDGQLLVCGPLTGTNLKVSKLLEAEKLAARELIVISDADVKVPPDFLVNAVQPLSDSGVGLVNSFYCFANPTTPAMKWEALAVNADFWSQVLQSQSLRPLDFALGAVMILRREDLKAIGGFAGLADCLADDYQLGNRIARLGRRIAICSVVAECWSAPVNWSHVWTHQLRWARTIRVCQPVPYFFSILSNATLWPVLWLALRPGWPQLSFCIVCLGVRMFAAIDLQQRMTQTAAAFRDSWLALLKDGLQLGLWALAFLGNKIEWRGEKMRLRKNGTLVKA